MAGNKVGGLKAAITNKQRHGDNFYAEIALKSHESWRRNGMKPRGFATDPELAREAGRKGGKISRRGK